VFQRVRPALRLTAAHTTQHSNDRVTHADSSSRLQLKDRNGSS
jgi:hypothetical protein